MKNQGKNVVSDATLACGGNNCCPRVRRYADGSATISDTVDGKEMVIELTPEQAKLAGRMLAL